MISTTSTRFAHQLRQMGADEHVLSNPKLQQAIDEIRELKRQKGAVVLSHYYMPAELQVTDADGGIADFVGDSLGLSVAASQTRARAIVFCGVKFMAETAKVLSPAATVLLPSMKAGCSLAVSISGEDVRFLKKKYPGVPVVAYVNTYAETKAEADICCTSRNALAIAKAMPGDQLIFLPDLYMGRNLQTRIKAETGKDLILWQGSCEVHEQFTPNQIMGLQMMYPEAELLVHWEVPDEVIMRTLSRSGGILGSTTDIIKYVGESQAQQFILASECDLGATLRGLYPQKEFVVPCIRCPHMKQIDVYRTLAAMRALDTPAETDFRIELDEEICRKAYLPIRRMLDFA
ncbi:quinolinate synthase NadA [Cesiribacter andamanensis]|uniref:quinolinate synthase n=1 Tax=Cesiribacter andamanensis AMV16 TaxID=1279009 RepID=M7NWW5_9BACT|nr:quinolinate synthase NadA [Cesiribacter andamanensis]EMR02954.1 Quinolinate synthase A [Cesiribacter andamanensis AMV16]